MPVTELNHYFVRSKDLEKSRHFYCDVLGFEVMPRPDFPFPGYWLGVNGAIQVHMGLDGIAETAKHYYGTTAASARDNAGVVDHIAFLASDPEAFAQRLRQIGLPSRELIGALLGFNVGVELGQAAIVIALIPLLYLIRSTLAYRAVLFAGSGAVAVIQPGGSMRDDDVIDAADERVVSMVFTGVLHFMH